VVGNKVWKTVGECPEEIGVPKVILSKHKVGLAAILGMVLEHHAETPPSVHGIQDLEEWDYAEAWLFSLDAPTCFSCISLNSSNEEGDTSVPVIRNSLRSMSSVFQHIERLEGSTSSSSKG
jgi:hypothetical protein